MMNLTVKYGPQPSPQSLLVAVSMLSAVLDWLDENNLHFPAIDVNNAIERLKLTEVL